MPFITFAIEIEGDTPNDLADQLVELAVAIRKHPDMVDQRGIRQNYRIAPMREPAILQSE